MWGSFYLYFKTTVYKNLILFFNFQTITGAMSTLTPPIQLEKSENQHRVDYIQDVASQHDFDYPSVSIYFELFNFCFNCIIFYVIVP